MIRMSIHYDGRAITPDSIFVPVFKPHWEQVIRFPMLGESPANIVDLKLIWTGELRPGWYNARVIITMNLTSMTFWEPALFYLGDNPTPYAAPLLGIRPGWDGIWLVRATKEGNEPLPQFEIERCRNCKLPAHSPKGCYEE